jgi:hypothetical protein
LLAIGACLAELGLNLKESEETAPRAAVLNRLFGNLRQVACDGTTSLLHPVIQRLHDELLDVSSIRPDLRDKCVDLQERLDAFPNAARLGPVE